ncbi:MAG: tautomerase family protein [Deltaproteobacteria bacterium]|nr:tautomerase family protein [Deltaproteobacteria bacterium]
MPSLDVTLPEVSLETRTRLARELTEAFADATHFERELLDVFFHEYPPGSAAHGGVMVTGAVRACHLAIACPRISRATKQQVGASLSAVFARVTGWGVAPVIHIQEFPYDNVVVDGQLLSDAFEACRQRRFYYPLED